MIILISHRKISLRGPNRLAVLLLEEVGLPLVVHIQIGRVVRGLTHSGELGRKFWRDSEVEGVVLVR